MGIKGFIPFVKKRDPSVFRPLTSWHHISSQVKGKTLAVDIPIFVHKMMHVLNTDDWITLQNEIVRMVELIRRFEANPIFVFDSQKKNALKVHEHSRRALVRKSTEVELNRIRTVRAFSTFAAHDDIDDEPLVVVSASPSDTTIKSSLEVPEVEVESKPKKARLVDDESLERREHSLMSRLLRPTSEHFRKLRLLFDSMGYLHEDADHEAEAHCAKLTQLGRADIVLTDDTDSIIFGATNVIFNFFRANMLLYGSTSELLPEEAPKIVSQADVLRALRFDRSQLVLFAIWAGCDFTEKIPKVGPVTAYKYALERNRKFPEDLSAQCASAEELFLSTWSSDPEVPSPSSVSGLAVTSVRAKSSSMKKSGPVCDDLSSFLDSL